jgi:hypothetical protein
MAQGAVKPYGALAQDRLTWQSLVVFLHNVFCTEVAMYRRDIRVNSPLEALVVEQALAMVREMKRVADAAPDGQVLDQAETVAVAQGRELTRKSLEAVLNEQAAEVEKKGRRAGRARAARRANTEDVTRGRSSRRPAR